MTKSGDGDLTEGLIRADKHLNMEYRQYPYRFLILLIYCLLSIVTGMCWVVVTPISVPVAKAYQVSDVLVSVIPLSYMLIYAFTNFPSNWLIEVKGLRIAVLVGAAGTALGTALRCLVSVHFMFVIAGQIVCAIVQPVILNAPTSIALRWFLPESRSMALAVLSVSNIVGTTLGVLLPSAFVEPEDSEEAVKMGFAALQMSEFVISALTLFLAIVWFEESPPSPASPSSEVRTTRYLDQVKQLFKSKKFLSLLLAFGVINGSFNIYGSLLDNLLDCYGFSSDEVGYFAAIMMVSGILTAGVVGFYIERTLNYGLIFRTMLILGLIECVGFPLVLLTQEASFILVLIMCAVMGSVFVCYIPLLFDFGCDVLYPAGQAQVTGCFMASGNFIGVLMIWATQFGLGLGKQGNSQEDEQNAAIKSISMVGVLTMLGLLIGVCFKGELKRSKLDQQIKISSVLTS